MLHIAYESLFVWLILAVIAKVAILYWCKVIGHCPNSTASTCPSAMCMCARWRWSKRCDPTLVRGPVKAVPWALEHVQEPICAWVQWWLLFSLILTSTSIVQEEQSFCVWWISLPVFVSSVYLNSRFVLSKKIIISCWSDVWKRQGKEDRSLLQRGKRSWGPHKHRVKERRACCPGLHGKSSCRRGQLVACDAGNRLGMLTSASALLETCRSWCFMEQQYASLWRLASVDAACTDGNVVPWFSSTCLLHACYEQMHNLLEHCNAKIAVGLCCMLSMFYLLPSRTPMSELDLICRGHLRFALRHGRIKLSLKCGSTLPCTHTEKPAKESQRKKAVRHSNAILTYTRTYWPGVQPAPGMVETIPNPIVTSTPWSCIVYGTASS